MKDPRGTVIMNRSVARRVAVEFVRGRGRIWTWINCHNELIDAEIMDQIRYANEAAPEVFITVGEIMNFRTMLVQELEKNGYAL